MTVWHKYIQTCTYVYRHIHIYVYIPTVAYLLPAHKVDVYIHKSIRYARHKCKH